MTYRGAGRGRDACARERDLPASASAAASPRRGCSTPRELDAIDARWPREIDALGAQRQGAPPCRPRPTC